MKRVLITGGPTAVHIDAVRVITNIATGATSLYLANALSKSRDIYTRLIISSASYNQSNNPGQNLDVRCFYTFDELKALIIESLQESYWDIVVHSAAVSDFGVKSVHSKLPSGKSLQLELSPLPKLWPLFDCDRVGSIVLFKLETDMDTAKKKGSGFFDLSERVSVVVANKFQGGYASAILFRDGSEFVYTDKQTYLQALANIVLGAVKYNTNKQEA